MSALPRPRLDIAALMDAEHRLYRLEAGDAALSTLRVEAWVAEEALDEPGRLEICCLADDPRLDLDAMLGLPVALVTLLADGTEHRRGGLVDMAIAEDCDGALARHRLIVRPWPWFLCMSARSQAWQDWHAMDIVDSLLERHASWARWRWSPCVHEHLSEAPAQGVRPYTVQYRETDLDFMSRLLAEDGIGYRLAHTAAGMEIVFFAESRFACPQDASSERAPIALQHATTQTCTSPAARRWTWPPAARMHAGQAIGVLGGAMQPGSEAAGTGLTVIAGAGELELQAQDGSLQVAAMQDVTFQTVQGAIDFAAIKRIVISTAGGAAVVLEGGDVNFVAPGTFTSRAGKRSFVGPMKFQYPMPVLPQHICIPCLLKARASGAPFVLR